MSNDYWQMPEAAKLATRAEIREFLYTMRESIAKDRAAAKVRRRREAMAFVCLKSSKRPGQTTIKGIACNSP